jgi:hypothetical protein
MAGINFHPAPGNINKMMPGWYGVRGVGDILATEGFAVPDRDMVAPGGVTYTATIGDILATQGFTVPDRSMNPVADFVSGNVKPLGQASGGCGGGCGCGSKGSLNGMGVGDIAADFAAIQNDFTTGNYMAILSAPIMGVPYGVPLALAALMILPGLLGGGGGGRRRR